MMTAVTIYFGVMAAIFVVALAVSRRTDRRLHDGERGGDDVPPGFEPTGELVIDPVDGKTRRVYFNAATGKRFYKEEP